MHARQIPRKMRRIFLTFFICSPLCCIGQRNPDGKRGSLSLTAVNFDRSSVHDHCITGNGKSQTCSSDFSRMRLVHPVKPLKNMCLILFRNSNAGVHHLHIKVLVIRIQGNSYPSFVPVIFDRILYQIGNGECQLHLIDLRRNGSEAFQYHLDFFLIGNRLQSF